MRIQMIDPQIADNATTARISEIAPAISETTLLLQEGENNRRSWGCVKVTSTVVARTRTFCAVHVGVTHKYRGGQQWYYFEQPAGEPLQRVTANKLSTRRRKQVLEAIREGNAPNWAKRPFTDPKPHKKPERHTRYKAVCRGADGSLRSLFDNSEYKIGKTRVQAAKPDHNGGFYVRRTPELALNAPLPNSAVNKDTPRIVLKCEVWGKCVVPDADMEFDDTSMQYFPRFDAKEAWTYCKVVEVVH